VSDCQCGKEAGGSGMTTQKFCTQNPGLAPACGWPPMGTLGKAVNDLILVAEKSLRGKTETRELQEN